MNIRETRDFLENISEHTEQEILENIQDINIVLHYSTWESIKEYLSAIFSITDRNKVLHELFSDAEKFKGLRKKLDFPEKLKFGVEIEVADLPLDVIRWIFESPDVAFNIMNTLKIPEETSNKIVSNAVFKVKGEFNKWIFSSEPTGSEASSPIMKNNLDNLNQIIAICTLLKALNARLNGGTGLHINVGVDYFECNEKAISNLLRIWGECEELFFKMASPEGEVIRIEAASMAVPIAQNIQDFFETDGSVSLKTEDDMEKFLYQIQARNRMNRVVAWSKMDLGEDLEYDLHFTKTDEEKFQIYHRYNQALKNKSNVDNAVRWTSINFNHMEWNADNPGRVEIRIFNSSLNPKIIFQDLILVGKIFEVSLENAKNPNYKKQEFENLFLRDVSESEKVNNLLKLLFEECEQRDVFKKRWQSVSKKDEYQRYESGQDTFQR